MRAHGQLYNKAICITRYPASRCMALWCT